MNIRRELICTARQAYADRLFAATSGNLSIFDRSEGKIYITPGSFPYEQMTEADAMVIDLDGNVLQGAHHPSSEWRLHTAVYRAYPEVNAVVHTHSPYATSFAINRTPIPAVLYEMVFFLGGDIPVARGAIPGTPEVGEYCAEALKDRFGCLMANHGALAVGDTLARAYTRAVYIEDAAKACALAMTHGHACEIGEEAVRTIRAKM